MVAVVTLLLTKFSTSRALTKFLTEDVADVHDKQLTDLAEAHGRRITALKREHDREQLRLTNRIKDADLKFDCLWGEHEYMSTLYQEKMRNNHEHEDRIQYLEKKLQEFGQSTHTARAPFSAPPTQISFLSPPRRHRFKDGFGSSVLKTPLSSVIEVDDE